MAPLLSFTAEEAWKVFRPAARTIFTEVFPTLPAVPGEHALVEKWTRLRAIRAEVQKKLEELREQGAIGSSLQAEVEIRANADDAALLRSLGDDLRFVLITSQARVETADHRFRDVIAHRSASTLHWCRCRCRPRPSDDLRALYFQPVWQWRATDRRLMDFGRQPSAWQRLLPWLGLAAAVILADQLTKLSVERAFDYGDVRPVTSFFNLVLTYNKGAAFSFLASASGWQGGF
jgi:hypothetical protein